MSELEDVAADMLRRGFVEVQEFGALKTGTRVRHVGEQYRRARREGTGTIERMFHKPKSAWAQTYNRPDIEIIVKADDGRYRYVADYHLEMIDAA